ncbi:hypothetical protein V8C86DRAFT_194922 [Haematococcus lacustris]
MRLGFVCETGVVSVPPGRPWCIFFLACVITSFATVAAAGPVGSDQEVKLRIHLTVARNKDGSGVCIHPRQVHWFTPYLFHLRVAPHIHCLMRGSRAPQSTRSAGTEFKFLVGPHPDSINPAPGGTMLPHQLRQRALTVCQRAARKEPRRRLAHHPIRKWALGLEQERRCQVNDVVLKLVVQAGCGQAGQRRARVLCATPTRLMRGGPWFRSSALQHWPNLIKRQRGCYDDGRRGGAEWDG